MKLTPTVSAVIHKVDDLIDTLLTPDPARREAATKDFAVTLANSIVDDEYTPYVELAKSYAERCMFVIVMMRAVDPAVMEGLPKDDEAKVKYEAAMSADPILQDILKLTQEALDA